MSDDNPLEKLAQLEPQKPKKQQAIDPTVSSSGRKSRVTRQSPMSTTRAQASMASGTKDGTYRGGMWNKLFRLPIEYEELVKQIVIETKAKSIADVERWLVARGLEAYFQDGERPEYKETVERSVQLPFTDDDRFS